MLWKHKHRVTCHPLKCLLPIVLTLVSFFLHCSLRNNGDETAERSLNKVGLSGKTYTKRSASFTAVAYGYALYLHGPLSLPIELLPPPP